jgi:hypothetical protein
MRYVGQIYSSLREDGETKIMMGVSSVNLRITCREIGGNNRAFLWADEIVDDEKVARTFVTIKAKGEPPVIQYDMDTFDYRYVGAFQTRHGVFDHFVYELIERELVTETEIEAMEPTPVPVETKQVVITSRGTTSRLASTVERVKGERA